MRIWTLHPRYLDASGLTALWREALLARAVLAGQTRGYREHPQLQRFRAHAEPRAAIECYLATVHVESVARGYRFDRSKLGSPGHGLRIPTSHGQLAHEWEHLRAKLQARSPAVFERWRDTIVPDPHPLFGIVAGPKEAWERG